MQNLVQVEAKILALEKVAQDTFYAKLQEGSLAERAKPGQFVHIRTIRGLAPLLRRPFSIAGTQPEEGAFHIYFHLTGEGTRLLSCLRTGDRLDCLGPLGTGFELPPLPEKAILLGGGIGVAPLLFLAQQLSRSGHTVTLFYGTPSAAQLIPVERHLLPGATLRLATEDGSAGCRGNVVEIFSKAQEECEGGWLFSCGPKPMLKALIEKNKRWRLPLQLSIEERMACGIGACQGCAVETASKDVEAGKSPYQRVCVEGPVFKDGEVRL